MEVVMIQGNIATSRGLSHAGRALDLPDDEAKEYVRKGWARAHVKKVATRQRPADED